MTPPYVVSTSFYLTGRAFFIQYLNEETDGTLANWVVKNESFDVQFFKLFKIWNDRACDDPNRLMLNLYCFASSYIAASNFVSSDRAIERYNIVTKASEKRKIVNDLTPGPLYEWLIRFLLEQTRTDWIDWTDKDKKEFQIFDSAAMGKMYAKVNLKSGNAYLYYIKLILSGYCSTKVLIPIDKRNDKYQFNPEWYQKEVGRKTRITINRTDLFDIYSKRSATLDSFLRFPEQTLPIDFENF